MALSRYVYRELEDTLEPENISEEPVVLEDLLMGDGTSNSSYISSQGE